MALRRLSAAHTYLRAAVTVRAASTTSENRRIFETEKPLCPGNAFTLFLETQERDGKSFKKYLFQAACKWNALSQDEKRIFQLKAKNLEKKYQQEVSHWEVRMQQSGHEDVVHRHRQLTDGKNLAVERSRLALMKQGQNSMLTTEEFPVMEDEKSHIKETIEEQREALVKRRKKALVKDIEREESFIKETEMTDSLSECSKSISSTKPFRSKVKQIVIVKSRKSFSW